MKTPHKHAELIKKWADDDSLIIEFKYDGNWKNAGKRPCWDETMEYRIKPEVIRYRVALRGNNADKWTTTAEDKTEEKDIQDSHNFIKWLTDWIEVELDEGEK